jgi:hypothetical protein
MYLNGLGFWLWTGRFSPRTRNIHTPLFLFCHPNLFICLFKLCSQKKLFLGNKNIGGGGVCPPSPFPQDTLMRLRA